MALRLCGRINCFHTLVSEHVFSIYAQESIINQMLRFNFCFHSLQGCKIVQLV